MKPFLISIWLIFICAVPQHICCKTGLSVTNFDCNDSCRVVTVLRFLQLSDSISEKPDYETQMVEILDNPEATDVSKSTACYILGEWRSVNAAPTLIGLLGTALIPEKNKDPFFLSDPDEALLKMGSEINPVLIERLASNHNNSIRNTLAIILFRNLEGNRSAFTSILNNLCATSSPEIRDELTKIMKASETWNF